MLIRAAHAGDNDALLALARTVSLPGPVRFGADRAPDFFALDRLLGEPFAHVAEEPQGAVAFADACLLDTRVVDRRVSSAYVSLAGVHPAFRGHGAVLAVIRHLEQDLRAAGCDLALGLVDARNPRAQAFFAMWPHGCVTGAAIALNLVFAARHARPREGIAIRFATAEDRPRIAALIAEHRLAYDVVPDVAYPIEASDSGLSITDFRLAEDRAGRLVACLALWDQHRWRRTPVLGYGPWMNVARVVLDALSRHARRGPLPRPGEPFRFAHVAFAAAAPGAESAFACLLRQSACEISARGWHFIAFGLPLHDPLGATLRGLLRLSKVSVPFLAPTERLAPLLRRLETPRVWIEYALV